MAKSLKDVVFKYSSPWAGIVARRNEFDLQPNEFPFLDNVVLFGDSLSNRVPFNVTEAQYQLPAGPTIAYYVFQDPVGTVSILDVDGGLNYAYRWQRTIPGTIPNIWSARTLLGANIKPVSDIITKNGIAYFSTIDGANKGYISTIVSPHTFLQNAASYVGGQYITELANHILLASCYDNAGVFRPNRLSWSAENLPLVWDPTVNTNAGFIDIVDINDSITGLINVDIYTYLFRSFGLSLINATGNGSLPFSVQHLINPNYQGRGCIFPGSLDGDGNIAIFVSNQDVEMLTTSGLQSIGGDATPFIFSDIKNSYPTVNYAPYIAAAPYTGPFTIIGSYLPRLDLDYPYPMYVLSIPTYSNSGINSIMWICDLSNLTNPVWTRHVISNFVLAAKIRMGNVFQGGGTDLTRFLPIVSQNFGSNTGGVSPWSVGPNYQSSGDYGQEIDFKTENADGLWVTIRNLRVFWKDLGPVAFFVKITGVDESGNVITTGDVPFNLNGTNSGAIKQTYWPIEFSCLLPQLTLTCAGSADFSLYRIDVIGQGEELEVI